MLTPQRALPSGFGPTTTADDVLRDVDVSGKVALVTGGYSGLGLETVRSLRAAGATVVVPARDVERARAAIAAVTSLDGVQIHQMDLADPGSVDSFADWVLAAHWMLHVLVGSAAIMALPERTVDARGFELQLATNHLGHFQLATRLWPVLLAAQGARVVSVSSLGHRFSPMMFDDPHYARRPYDPWTSYGQSKTANALFAVSLDERGRDHGVRAFSVHPGGIAGTGLQKHVPTSTLVDIGFIDAEGKPIIDIEKRQKTVPMGAATQVWCATSRQLDGMGGVYCEDVDLAPLVPATEAPSLALGGAGKMVCGVMDFAVDATNAQRLWELSERMLGRDVNL